MAARKKTTTKKKSGTSSRKKTPTRKKTATRKTSTRRKVTTKPKSAPAKPKSAPRARPKAAPIQTGMSADRKMELVGFVLGLVGVLTLLSILSGGKGGLGDSWVNIWRKVMGWGAYLLPVVLILLGVWFVARNFKRVPQVSVERLLGGTFMFVIVLVCMHLYISAPGKEAAYYTASQGLGGGYIGGWLMVILEGGLGTLGMIIALGAWFLISLAMALDRSVIDLFRWVGPLVLRLQDAWDERKAAAETPAVTYSPPPPDDPSAVQAGPMEPPPPGDPAAMAETMASPVPNAVVERRDWVLPQVGNMLDEGAEVVYSDEHDRQRANVIEETLASFGAPATVVEINRGPTITQFGVEPDFIESRSGRTRVRVGKIAALADDLSLALAASRIRIQAPVPGKGYVGIEVPNEEIAVVALRDVIESAAFSRLQRAALRFALGQDVAGNAVAADLTGMPHLLVAGATGSGKSVFVNALISGMLLHNTPETLRMIMVDPKRVELTGYNGIPHLLAPVVTEVDRVVGVLQWVTREMDSRYQRFADVGARNIDDFNSRMNGQGKAPLPYLVLVIDELADLMMVAPDQTERLITRMAQLARATGIHLVISTQRPSVDVVTGLIKANFPARISFAVASGVDSRVVLDQPGAERLLGRGDMLFQAPDAPAPVRLQGVFVSDPEILRIVQYWRGFSGTTETAPVATSTPYGGPGGISADAPPKGVPLKQMEIWNEMQEMEKAEDQDPMYAESVSLVRRQGRASVSMLQRRLRIGYTRAARIVEQMEEEGIIGPATGSSSPREVIDYGQGAPPADED